MSHYLFIYFLFIYFHPFRHICDIGHSIYKLRYILTYKKFLTVHINNM